jgi:hypothetical protein
MSAYSALIAATEQMSPGFVCEISGGRVGTPQWNAARRALTALSLSLSLSLHSSLTRSDQRDRSRPFFSFSLIYVSSFYTLLCLPFRQSMAVPTCPQGKLVNMCSLAASCSSGRLFVRGNSGAAERTVVSICQCLSVSVSTFQLLYIWTYLRVYVHLACQ